MSVDNILSTLKRDGFVDLDECGLYPSPEVIDELTYLSKVGKRERRRVNGGRIPMWIPKSKLSKSAMATFDKFSKPLGFESKWCQILIVPADSGSQYVHRDFHDGAMRHLIVGVSLNPKQKLKTLISKGTHEEEFIEQGNLEKYELTPSNTRMYLLDAQCVHCGSPSIEEDSARFFIHLLPCDTTCNEMVTVIQNQDVPLRLVPTNLRKYLDDY